jgi:putative membrane protein
MLKSLLFLAAAAAFASAGSAAFAAPDQAFLSKAIKGDNSEVELGKLALNMSASQGVKSFAQTLVTDHTAAKAKASAVAKQIGLAPPAEATEEAQIEYNKLRGLNGAQFEREFVNYMVADHKKDIAEFKQEASSGQGPVAKLAADTLPVLEKHLSIAESLKGKV